MRRAFKFRLYPSKTQARDLAAMLETHRHLWNTCLAQRKETWERDNKSLGYCAQAAWLTGERKANPYLARVNHTSAQGTLRRLDTAFQAFFRRVKAGEKPGYPRFKARDRWNSALFPAYGDGIRLYEQDGKVRVHGVGHVKAKVHRPVEGTVKTACIKREADHWYLVLSCEIDAQPRENNRLPAIGIDLGLEAFLTTSEGTRVANPRFLKKELPALRRAQRSVSRRKKGSRNRHKAIHHLQRLHARIANLRHEHHHKVALKLVRAHGLIAAESLNVNGLLRTGRLARAISDAGWSGFVNTLTYKAESAGCELVLVNPRGTSQECSRCGVVVPKGLHERQHCCSACGLVLHRDENAARNILARGLMARTGPAGANGQLAVA